MAASRRAVKLSAKEKKPEKAMDLMDMCAVPSTGGNKQRVNKRNRDWHKRLHLRKTFVEPSTMQSEDKSGPKKIAEEWERSPAWSSSKKSLQEAQQSHNTLRFACSHCRDDLEYVPKDLVRHFEEKHKGSPPVFPCHTCAFNSHEFSYLQVHLLSHKDTFSSCSICNDNVQRSWSEFSIHLTMCHCQNGKYLCEICQTFSTSDVQVFLEHMCVHNVHLEGAGGDLLLHTKDKDHFGPTTTTRMFGCQHCDYEASQKLLISKHIKAVHACQSSNQRKKKKEVNSLAMKPNDPVPKMKPRLTRSAVRDMCWLTQDCLSLPGREFLDKYCHLSDPQTTLEETQQFLMKSVARETGDPKWTKALKTVLSNVPQDINLHPKSENGIMLNSDLTVLTVKNKITVAQNSASYSKRLKRMTSSDKEVILDSAVDDACCVVDQNGCQPLLSDHALCTQTETKLHSDISASAQNEPFERTQLQENRENRELETQEDHGKHQESMDEDGNNNARELKLTNEHEEQPSVRKVPPKNRKSQRWKRNPRYKKVDRRSSALKIVLKKNPVKGKRWVSRRALCTSGRGSTGPEMPDLHTTIGATVEMSQKALLTQVQQTSASKVDLPDTSTSQLKPGVELSPSCVAKPTGLRNMNVNEAATLDEGSLSMHQEVQGDAEMSSQSLKYVDKRSSTGKTGWSNTRAAAETCSDNIELQAGSGVDDHMSEKKSSATDGVTPLNSYTKPCPVSQPVITSQGNNNLEESSLALSAEQSKHRDEGMRDGELPVDPSSDFVSSSCSPEGKAILQEPSPTSGHGWQPAPRNLERTLKLVAINPSQLVKRPAGDQPVVVLNHPDADIPEVVRIMEVVNRYRGEVQKVVLSHRTLNALSAVNGELSKTDSLPDSGGHGKNSVQERFILKLKLRRLSRKKYEVVGSASPSKEDAPKFRCWFCGRVFESQEVWMVHRQRHLME